MKGCIMKAMFKTVALGLLFIPLSGWSAAVNTTGFCEVNTGSDVVGCVSISPSHSIPSVVFTDSVSAGIGKAQYHVRADYGNVGLSLNSQTLASSGQFSTSAQAKASAEFWDEVLVTSGSYALGTPVTVKATLAVNGDVYAQSTSILGEVTSFAHAWLQANYEINASDGAGALLQFSVCNETPYFAGACALEQSLENAKFEFSFNTFVGSLLLVHGSMVAGTYAGVGANEVAGSFPGNFAEVGALNSSHTYLSAVGVSFVGASGHVYDLDVGNGAEVSEPSSLALMLAGFGACFAGLGRGRTGRRLGRVLCQR
jgi:hypothetical protein